MGSSNGVVRIGRKGRVKFAFGEDGKPFEVDVVEAQREWYRIDETFRVPEGEPDEGTVPADRVKDYHDAAVAFCNELAGEAGGPSSKAEALDFLARLREQYDAVKAFFLPKSLEEPESPGSSGSELQFSEES